MGQFVGINDVDNNNTKKSLKPSRDDVFLGIALGATEPHRIEKLIPPVITNTREWLLYMAGTDPKTLKGYYNKNDGRGDQQGDKELILSWVSSGSQVTVFGAKEGLELAVDPKSGTDADAYIDALRRKGISLEDPLVLSIGVYDKISGEPYMSQDLSMTIRCRSYGVYNTFYRIDGDPSTSLPEIKTLTSDDSYADAVCVDNPVYPAVYVVGRYIVR